MGYVTAPFWSGRYSWRGDRLFDRDCHFYWFGPDGVDRTASSTLRITFCPPDSTADSLAAHEAVVRSPTGKSSPSAVHAAVTREEDQKRLNQALRMTDSVKEMLDETDQKARQEGIEQGIE